MITIDNDRYYSNFDRILSIKEGQSNQKDSIAPSAMSNTSMINIDTFQAYTDHPYPSPNILPAHLLVR
ncbi:hypothetical protein C8R27_11218 [Nitrosomonas ureae]|uniref:Uncharacterized protein n=1 Tax=Nitrosomonas ureae TaxID=44577 RepID=A0A2T5IC24_9PROT|nr:hypothetical protein C8R28_103218 [Nitrosomonas ureae]PXX15029.1 hypothetical protein C8R27_11218 [Nitrosomonas ureae]